MSEINLRHRPEIQWNECSSGKQKRGQNNVRKLKSPQDTRLNCLQLANRKVVFGETCSAFQTQADTSEIRQAQVEESSASHVWTLKTRSLGIYDDMKKGKGGVSFSQSAFLLPRFMTFKQKANSNVRQVEMMYPSSPEI